jgi:hypothetical protein
MNRSGRTKAQRATLCAKSSAPDTAMFQPTRVSSRPWLGARSCSPALWLRERCVRRALPAAGAGAGDAAGAGGDVSTVPHRLAPAV